MVSGKVQAVSSKFQVVSSKLQVVSSKFQVVSGKNGWYDCSIYDRWWVLLKLFIFVSDDRSFKIQYGFDNTLIFLFNYWLSKSFHVFFSLDFFIIFLKIFLDHWRIKYKNKNLYMRVLLKWFTLTFTISMTMFIFYIFIQNHNIILLHHISMQNQQK